LLAATAVPLSSGAQAKAEQSQPTFRTGVDVVRLDVSVLDKKRRPVPNLTADFTVMEEGEPRSLLAFSAIDLPDAPTHGARWTGPSETCCPRGICRWLSVSHRLACRAAETQSWR
jgi:hypothetical protein